MDDHLWGWTGELGRSRAARKVRGSRTSTARGRWFHCGRGIVVHLNSHHSSVGADEGRRRKKQSLGTWLRARGEGRTRPWFIYGRLPMGAPKPRGGKLLIPISFTVNQLLLW